MAQFRLTQKYAKDRGVKRLDEPPVTTHPLDDWLIDVIRIQRKKVAMVTHVQSIFTFLIPYGEVGGALAIPGAIGALLQHFLYEHDMAKWIPAVEKSFSEEAHFYKTINKKVLGHMNDFKRCIEHFIYSVPKDAVDLKTIENYLNKTLINFPPLRTYCSLKEILKYLLVNHPF